MKQEVLTLAVTRLFSKIPHYFFLLGESGVCAYSELKYIKELAVSHVFFIFYIEREQTNG